MVPIAVAGRTTNINFKKIIPENNINTRRRFLVWCSDKHPPVLVNLVRQHYNVLNFYQ